MLTKQKILEILSNRIEEIDSLKIPHFSLLSDIKKATKRIIKAIEKKEKIAIVGDYDVDGVSSCAIMKLFFEKLGVDVKIVIPNRFEDGYGLTPNLLKKIDANLIITVDNGITSFLAVDMCNELNIDVIITDHHTPIIKDKVLLPNAYAIVNPKLSEDFPFKEICGAEVAWYLCAAIKNELKLNIDLREFLDILAIAIIADVMPLTHMNRTLTIMGLKRLNQAKKAFSLVIKEFFNKEITSDDIYFQIAPRINAAGRLDDAYKAFLFLIEKDKQKAFNLWLELDRLNNLRKEIEKEILEDIKVDIEDKFIVLKGDYNEGVIGIIASKIVNKYKRPAIVFSKKDNILKGSGRSLGNINIFKLVSECEDLLEGFGGHKMACGVKIKDENFEKFKKLLNEKINIYDDKDFFIEDFILGELPFSEIDFSLLEILKKFEPYGEANPKPKFITKANIKHIQPLKNNHYKLILYQNGIFFPALLFNFDGGLKEEINFKFTINENRFFKEIELIIEEII